MQSRRKIMKVFAAEFLVCGMLWLICMWAYAITKHNKSRKMTVGAVHKTETWWKLCMYAVHASCRAQCQHTVRYKMKQNKIERKWNETLRMCAIHGPCTAQCQAMQQAVTVCSCYESKWISGCMVNILGSKWLSSGKRQTGTTWKSLPTRSQICMMLYNTAAHTRQWLFHTPRPCAYVPLDTQLGLTSPIKHEIIWMSHTMSTHCAHIRDRKKRQEKKRLRLSASA